MMGTPIFFFLVNALLTCRLYRMYARNSGTGSQATTLHLRTGFGG